MIRPLDLEALKLLTGAHSSPDEGMCVMEAVAFVAGESHSDHPKCACETIGDFMRSWNDSGDDAIRERMKSYIPRLVGTNRGPEVALKRSYMVADWYARVFVPAWLKLAEVAQEEAAALEALPPATDYDSLHATDDLLSAAQEKASAARSAAESAAWSAARSAAWSAAESAAWSAAESAARSAARSAAESAAWSAAESAARSAAESAAEEKLKPTRDYLIDSAFALLDRMIEVRE